MNILTAERIKKELSQSELARRCQLNASYISKVENGLRIPSPETIAVICNVLEICPIPLYVYFYQNNKCHISKNKICDINNCYKCLIEDNEE